MLDRDSRYSGSPSTEFSADLSVHAGYQVHVSHEPEASEWDSFLAATHGGHHVQTSLWAQVKAIQGWHPVRVMVRQREHIVAGAQILIRPLPLVGAIGYISKGPLIAVDDPLLAQLMIDELLKVAKAQRIQYLIVQPPDNGTTLAQQLHASGFRSSSHNIAPVATVLLDLSQDLEEILAQMKIKTRQNIRRGQRQGMIVREGTERDLSTYYRLLVATGQRQNFSVYPEEYFLRMWRVLRPHGYLQMFVAEYEGEVVSAQLVVPFGDTVINKLSVWSGRHGNRRPNELLQWTTIVWAKTQGYRYYDFEGISPKAASAVLQGRPLPDSMAQTVTSFKLGFGGQVVVYPGAYDYVCNPVLRWAYTTLFPNRTNASAVKKLRKRFRMR